MAKMTVVRNLDKPDEYLIEFVLVPDYAPDYVHYHTTLRCEICKVFDSMMLEYTNDDCILAFGFTPWLAKKFNAKFWQHPHDGWKIRFVQLTQENFDNIEKHFDEFMLEVKQKKVEEAKPVYVQKTLF